MVRQSPPIDLSIPYDAAWVKGKTILITGGASGFGAGFVRKWAANGATVIFGDINVEKGDKLARDVQKETGNNNVHFVYCDVTDWQSQVNLFKAAVKLSPHGGIDTVVANAGIAGNDPIQQPGNMDVAEPAKPDFKVADVNFNGVMYTTHLAFFYLPRNPGSKDCSTNSDPATTPRDRHLLFLGSLASLAPFPIQPQYGAAKHAVLGLFRSLRSSSFVQGVRVNLLCPYFIDTPIVTTAARVVLAGSALGKVEDVVDAGTRFTADSRILGRSLVIGPKVNVKQLENGEWVLVAKDSPEGQERAVWEAYAEDWEDSDAFCRALVGILNAAQKARGWTGWAKDMVGAVAYGLGFNRG
ncbi:NAD(P)-binding protein [Lepidopterella palustris CBS 459.81]|uniref:NAD(P)-binding protein n=1 Tax=Lepidopterella palustris CBS 459.81 TaxID=1314670 RepID=A0A8E2E9X4_9PEZI|nr:NAD(P)-binding protein [Lepidopterella palustris CBS 459.81]